MKKIKLKNKLKSEKGSITIFVLTSMFFFLVILLSIYMNNVNKNSNINKDIKSIEEQYNVTEDDLEKAYQEKVNKDRYPEPWAEIKLENNDRFFNGTNYHPINTNEQKFPELLGYPDEAENIEDVSTKGKAAITVSATIKAAPINAATIQKFVVGNAAGVGWNIYISISLTKVGFSFSVSKEKDVWENIDTGMVLDTGKVYNLIATFSRGKMILEVFDKDMNSIKSEIDTEIDLLDQLNDVNTLIGGNPKCKSDLNFGNTIIDNGTGFNGSIYDVKIWDKVLTEEQRNKLATEQIALYKDQ